MSSYIITRIPSGSHNKVKDMYYKLISFLPSCESRAKRINGDLIRNKKLIQHCNTQGPDKPLKPYFKYACIKIPQLSTMFPNYTLDRIKSVDVNMLDIFNEPSPAHDWLPVSLIVTIGIKTAMDLCMFNLNMSDPKLTPLDSVLQTAKNTGSGFPLFRSKLLGFVQIETVNEVTRLLQKPSYEAILRIPCINYHRFQSTVSYDFKVFTPKIRLVMGYPYCITAMEAVYFKKFFEESKRRRLLDSQPISASGLSQGAISRKISSRFNRFSNVLSLDFSKFDSSVPNWLWCIYFSVIFVELGYDTSDKALMCLVNYSITTPICFDGEHISFLMKGVASGSFQTNDFDTFVNVFNTRLSQHLECLAYLKGIPLFGKGSVERENITSDNNAYGFLCRSFGDGGFHPSIKQSSSFKGYIKSFDRRREVATLSAILRTSKTETTEKNACYCWDNDFSCSGDDLIISTVTNSAKNIIRTGLVIGLKPSDSGCYEKKDRLIPFHFLGFYWDTNNLPRNSLSWYVSRTAFLRKGINLKKLNMDYGTYLLNKNLAIASVYYDGLFHFKYLYSEFDSYYKELINNWKNRKITSIEVKEDMYYPLKDTALNLDNLLTNPHYCIDN